MKPNAMLSGLRRISLSGANACRISRQLLATVVLSLISASVAAASGDDFLKVREIPALTSWADIRSFILRDTSIETLSKEGVTLEETANSLSLTRGKDFYQLVLHQGDVIQYSTVTLREMRISGDAQFGRSPVRSIAPYLRADPQLKIIARFLRASGVKIQEGASNEMNDDFRSALYYPADGTAPSISLSDRFAKHPVFGFAHEAQHFLNQAMLPVLIDRILGSGALFSAEANSLKSYLDEYLAVRAEIEAFRALGGRFPHLAGHEVLELSRMSEEELRKYVFEKWGSYYQWPKKILTTYLERGFDGEKLLQDVRTHHSRFGTKSDLPQRERALLHFEQKQNPKLVDENVIASPNNSHIPWIYRPEAGLTFPLRTVWIPQTELNLAGSIESLSPELQRELKRTDKNGVIEYAFFIHPLSEKKFEDLIARYESSFDFVASPGSSNRTLLLRSLKSAAKFYVKTSLAIRVAGIERLIPAAEVSRSVGDSLFLNEVAQRDSRVLFLPEPLAIIPKGMERGGQVIRLLNANEPTGQLVPLFSFYSQENGFDLTRDLASARRLTRSEFLRREIVGPLVALLTDLRDRHHFVHEAHAQNILVEMVSGFPSGRFVFKDLAGITVDLSKYPNLIERLPRFISVDKEYYQAERHVAFNQAFEVFLKSGFLYGVDQYLKRTEPRYMTETSIFSILQQPQRAILPNSCSRLFAR